MIDVNNSRKEIALHHLNCIMGSLVGLAIPKTNPGIHFKHFKSQSRDLKVIGISGLKIVIFGQILAHFWSFLAKFWLVVKLFSPNYVQYSDLVLELYENLQFMNFWTF